MFNEIVGSDVDLVRGLMEGGHPDAEILADLALRGLEPAKASRLVDDLRHGRKPSVQLPFELQPARDKAVGGRTNATGQRHGERHVRRDRSGGGRHEPSSVPGWFILLILIFLCALGYVLFDTGSSPSAEAIDKDKHELPPAPGKLP